MSVEHFRQHCPCIGSIGAFLETEIICHDCVCPVCYRLCTHCVDPAAHMYVPADSPAIAAIADSERQRADANEERFEGAVMVHSKTLPAMLIEDLCEMTGFPAGFWQLLMHRHTGAEMLLSEPFGEIFKDVEELETLFAIVGIVAPPQERYMTTLARCGRVLTPQNRPFRLTVRNASDTFEMVQLEVTLWGFRNRYIYTGAPDPTNLFALLGPMRCYRPDYLGVDPEPTAVQGAISDIMGPGPGRGLWDRRYFGQELGSLESPPNFWVSRLGGLAYETIPYGDTMVRGAIVCTQHMSVENKIAQVVNPVAAAVQSRVLVVVGHPRVAALWNGQGIMTIMDTELSTQPDGVFKDMLVVYDNITALTLPAEVPLHEHSMALIDVNYKSLGVSVETLSMVVDHTFRPAMGSFTRVGRNRAQLVRLIDAVVRVPSWRSSPNINVTAVAMRNELVQNAYERITHIHRLLQTKGGAKIVITWLRGGGDHRVPPNLLARIDEACESTGIVTEDTKCPVCLEVKELRMTRCNHAICTVCIREWHAVNPTCPLCRGEMLPDRDATHVSKKMIDYIKEPWPLPAVAHEQMRELRANAIAAHLLDQHNDGCHRVILVSPEPAVAAAIVGKVDAIFIAIKGADKWETMPRTESLLFALSPGDARHGLELSGVDLIVFDGALDEGGIREHIRMVDPTTRPPVHIMFWDNTVEKGWADGMTRRRPAAQRPISDVLEFRMRMMIR